MLLEVMVSIYLQTKENETKVALLFTAGLVGSLTTLLLIWGNSFIYPHNMQWFLWGLASFFFVTFILSAVWATILARAVYSMQLKMLFIQLAPLSMVLTAVYFAYLALFIEATFLTVSPIILLILSLLVFLYAYQQTANDQEKTFLSMMFFTLVTVPVSPMLVWLYLA